MVKIKVNDSFLLRKILNDLEDQFSDNIISVYGIGSYFDESLPSDWIKKDLDLIVIVNSLEAIPKPDWTEIRYERKKLEDCEVWLAFNTLEAYQNKSTFEKQSFSNYEWSLLDLKLPENSIHLYGQDIREKLPDIAHLNYDFDDILARSLYHFDNSFKVAIKSKNTMESMREFTKGVFKFGFYICIYFDNSFRYTSIRRIATNIEKLHEQNILDDLIVDCMKQSILFRRSNTFPEDYIKLRNKLVLYIFALIGKGKLHRKMNFNELKYYLKNTFRGLKYLLKFAQKIKKNHNQLKLKAE
ncbi:MAG: hypothetical protein EU532_02925 [Promethearchaeota archaeon]|nr:MAG: hypothetical protein EU532_02925 [Candidatus Lokiarchaeota archaeon]